MSILEKVRSNILLKHIFYALSVLSAALLFALMSINLFLNPNHFKQTLEERFNTQTGYQLTLKGPLRWHVSPGLALNVSDVVLKRSPKYTNELMVIKQGLFKISLWSLITGRLALDVRLQEVALNLDQYTTDKTRFEAIQEPLTHFFKHSRYALNSLEILDAQLNYHDPLANTYCHANNIYLFAEKMIESNKGAAIPIRLALHLEKSNWFLPGALALKGELKLQQSQLKVNSLHFTPIQPTLPTLSFTGSLQMKSLETLSSLKGEVQFENYNVHPWVSASGMKMENAHPLLAKARAEVALEAGVLQVPFFSMSIQNMGVLEGKFTLDAKEKHVQGLKLNGSVQAERLVLNTLELQNIKAFISAKDGLFDIAPLDFKVLKSPQQAMVQIDAREQLLKFTLSHHGDSFEIAPLLSLFDQKNIVTGALKSKTFLQAKGSSFNEILRTLEGRAEIEIQEGKLFGIDLPPLLKHAQSTVLTVFNTLKNKQSINITAFLAAELREWQHQALSASKLYTAFDSAKITLGFANGVLSSEDLKIVDKGYKVEGRGTLDLLNKQLTYQTNILPVGGANQTTDEIANVLQTIPLSINIKGTLTNPSVRPELENYTQRVIQTSRKPQQTKSQVKNDVTSLESLFEEFPQH